MVGTKKPPMYIGGSEIDYINERNVYMVVQNL